MRQSFEFCAMRYFLQWQRHEEKLYTFLKPDNPELRSLRKALRYFQVARNFEGLKRDARAQKVLDCLLDTRTQAGCSLEGKVSRLATSFKEAGFQHNLSAASKLLWLSSRKPIIYDSRALAALEKEYGHKDKSKKDSEKYYKEYCTSWKRAYKKNEQSVFQAVEKLPLVRAFLPGDTPAADKLLDLVKKQWFCKRVFDIYLWELGSDS